jgi:hypothetical protein
MSAMTIRPIDRYLALMSVAGRFAAVLIQDNSIAKPIRDAVDLALDLEMEVANAVCADVGQHEPLDLRRGEPPIAGNT